MMLARILQPADSTAATRPLRRQTTGLLVSVRDSREAEAALDGRADVIDVKEPRRGSLGAADRSIVERVVALVDRRCVVSVAGGELVDYFGKDRRRNLPVTTRGIDFFKLGLAGCASRPDWRRQWQRAIGGLGRAIRLVAVVYADWKACRAPEPAEVLAAAVELGCANVLVDTYDKSSGTLFDHWRLAEVGRFVEDVRSAGRAVVLAGSLSGPALVDAVRLSPDLVAVRGAVCSGGRTGSVSSRRVAAIRRLVDTATAGLARG